MKRRNIYRSFPLSVNSRKKTKEDININTIHKYANKNQQATTEIHRRAASIKRFRHTTPGIQIYIQNAEELIEIKRREDSATRQLLPFVTVIGLSTMRICAVFPYYLSRFLSVYPCVFQSLSGISDRGSNWRMLISLYTCRQIIWNGIFFL